MPDQPGGLSRLYLVHRLGEDLQRDVVAPSLVLGRLVVLLGKGSDERLGSWRVDQVMPHERPSTEKVALAGPPRHRSIKAKPSDREIEAELRILLQEVRYLKAGEVRYHQVGLRRSYLQQEGGKIGSIRRHELVGRELAAIGFHETLGNPQQIVTEGVVGGEREPFLALDKILREKRTAHRLHIHRVGRLYMCHELLAALATQFI